MPLPALLPILGGLASGVAGGLTSNFLNRGIKSYKPQLPQPLPTYNPNVPNQGGLVQAPTSNYNQAQDIRGQADAAQMSQYSMNNPFGSVSWSGDTANGTRRLNVNLGGLEKGKLNAAQSMLPTLTDNYGDAASQRSENSVFNRFQRRMDPLFKQENDRLHTQLLAQGLPVGSDAYKNSVASLQQGQRDAYMDAADRSILTGQQSRSQALQDALGLFGTVSNVKNPMDSYVPGLGGNFTSAYQNMQTNKNAYDQMGLQTGLANMNNTLAYNQMKHQAELEKQRISAQQEAQRMETAKQFELANMQAAREREAANRKTNNSIGSGVGGFFGKLFG